MKNVGEPKLYIDNIKYGRMKSGLLGIIPAVQNNFGYGTLGLLILISFHTLRARKNKKSGKTQP
jgi:hypothetical protein